MKHVLVLFVVCLGSSQLTVTFSSVTVNIFPTVTVNLFQDAASPYYPADYILSTQASITNFYTLGSNQIVQIYDKHDPSVRVQTFSNLSFSNGPAQRLTKMVIDETQQLLILTSYENSIVSHIIYNISTEGIISHFKTVGGFTCASPPIYVGKYGKTILSYHNIAGGNDELYQVDFHNNSTQNFPVYLQNCQVAINPVRTKSILWTTTSHLYIIDTQTFSLERQYTLSVTSDINSTNNIAFSADSTLAILQTDTAYPIRVIEVSTGATLTNITATGIVYSAVFLEASNRFVLVQQAGGSFVYDRQTDTSASFIGLISDNPLFVDVAASELFSVGSASVQFYGIDITDGNTTLTSYSPPTDNSSSSDVVEPGVVNETQQTKDVTPQSKETLESSFYIDINYTKGVNKTLTNIVLVMDRVDDIVDTMFSILLSTPLAVYFFSTFNYFALSSLYIFLKIKMPKVVYADLAGIFVSSQTNALQQMGINYSFPSFSEEQVNNQKAAYLGVTSDIFPPNIVDLFLILFNILVFEVLVFFTSARAFNILKVNKLLTKDRTGVYWGLLIGLLVPLLLPWTFSIPKGTNSLPTAINSALQLLLLFLFTFLVIAAFLKELRLSRSRSKKGLIKRALREWWSSYETYVYAISLLLPDPIYFMVIVGLSNYFALYLSFSAEKRKVLEVLKALYPIIFHGCFWAFMITSSHDVLMWSSLLCLGVFLIGSLHHLFQAVIFLICLICKMIRSICFNVQIKPMNSNAILRKCQNNFYKKRSKQCKIDERISKAIVSQATKDQSKGAVKFAMINNLQMARTGKNKKIKIVRDEFAEAQKYMVVLRKPKTQRTEK